MVALRAATGELAWGFQLVHHDLWDYDMRVAAVLVDALAGRRSRARRACRATRPASLFVLDRETGAPVFPVEERPVPQSDVPGEAASPTQPFPIALPAARRRSASRPTTRGASRRRIATRAAHGSRGLRNDGVFTPPSLQGTLVMPGNVGGMNWSGFAFDPPRHLADRQRRTSCRRRCG